MIRRAIAAVLAVLSLAAPAAAGALRLLMVEQQGCVYCLAWDRDVGDAYHLTPEGRTAPLVRVDLRAPLPEGVELVRPAVFTPTFVLLAEGREVARIEGYPGEDFFYGLLGRMLTEAGGTPPS